MFLDHGQEESPGDQLLKARRKIHHEGVQVLPLIQLVMNLAQVGEDFSLNVRVQLDILHGSSRELNLL